MRLIIPRFDEIYMLFEVVHLQVDMRPNDINGPRFEYP